MKHLRIIGLCLVAVFAFVAVAAASASAAEPEWAGCVKLAKAKGNFTEAKCETVATKLKKGKAEPDHKGAYEFESGQAATCVAQKDGNFTESKCETVAGKTKKGVFSPDHKGKFEIPRNAKFTGKGGVGYLEGKVFSCTNEHGEEIGPKPREDCHHSSPTGIEISCETESATGEAVGAKEVANVAVRFTGCEGLGVPATSAGLNPGEIETYKLQGRLGYLNKSATPEPEVGLLLGPAATHGLFANIELASAEIRVGEGSVSEGSFYEEAGHPGVPTGNDGIISPIEPVNTMTHTFTQQYKEAGTGPAEYENTPDKFEGAGEPVYLLEVLQHGPEPTYTTDWGPASEEIENVNTLEEGYAEIKG